MDMQQSGMVAIAAHARVLEQENVGLRARVAQLEEAARSLLAAIGPGVSEYTNLGGAMNELEALLDGNAAS